MTSLDSRRDRVQTCYGRRGRLRTRHRDALARLLPAYGVDVNRQAHFDRQALFGRCVPLVLEIGSGMGEATARMAAADPGRDYLAVEVHPPGVANLLLLIEERGLTNVRVAHGDALELVERRIAPGSLDAVHAFFPDPWPKTRHHKRRLFQAAQVALLRSRLAPDGILHAATDWPEYAGVIHRALAGDPELVAGPGRRAPARRPVTKYERRAIAAGRPIFELVFHREDLAGCGP